MSRTTDGVGPERHGLGPRSLPALEALSGTEWVRRDGRGRFLKSQGAEDRRQDSPQAFERSCAMFAGAVSSVRPLDLAFEPVAARLRLEVVPDACSLTRLEAGNWIVNDMHFDVWAGERVQSVAERISESAVGVHASYEPTRETLTFTSKLPGSSSVLSVRDEGTGFGYLFGLAGAELEPGRDAETAVRMDAVPSFAGVCVGTIVLNGVPIDVDPARDTLETVLARIRSSTANVEVQLYASSAELRMSAGRDQELALESDTSGLLEALAIPLGVYRAMAIEPGTGSGAERSRLDRSA